MPAAAASQLHGGRIWVESAWVAAALHLHAADRGAEPALEAEAFGRYDVTDLGAVLVGTTPERRSDNEITAFDSTGLAIQDLAIALAAMERAAELDLPTLPL